jgi:LysM domain
LLTRLAAPAAFLLAATVAVLLVRSALHAGGEETARKPPTVRTDDARRRRPPRREERPRRRDADRRVYYRVQTGDTLETIAVNHGTSTTRLLQLNPAVDPRSLRVGQRIRVR